MLDKVKGIGPKKISLLNKLGIYTINDLLTYFPYKYDVIEETALDNKLDKIIIPATIASIPLVSYFGKLNKLNFKVNTKYGLISVGIFNRAFLKNNLTINKDVIIIGKYNSEHNSIQANDILLRRFVGKMIEPKYHLTKQLTNKTLISFIDNAYIDYQNLIEDNLPRYLLNKYDFYSKKMSVNIVHHPPNKEKLIKALERLKYEELFEFMFKINYLKTLRNKEDGILRDNIKWDLKDILKTLTFTLTNDQLKALDDIIRDLKSSRRMSRILQGDVGSGKTIVAFLSMYFNYLSGYQSALMAPTEILASQHYKNLKNLTFTKNINVELLISNMKAKDKQRIIKELSEGKIDILIGTHAIIQESIEYYNLGLVITDEQHRFGVNQRTLLSNKGCKPDILYMSATPIPRTYALTIYGDMDVSSIKEMPKGRQPVKTMIKTNKEILDVLQKINDELLKGHQIYVIAPLIEENEESDLNHIGLVEDNMKKAFGKKYNIASMHGKMKAVEKELIMQEFKQGKIDILVSTTVIEVGVDVENASMIVIYDANRYGLSTLHQLRGRVGRSSIESYCILVSSDKTDRLEIMCNTNDGFIISEEDFKLRGSGELFGTKQSGDMNFKVADMKRDFKILLQAKEDAIELLNNKTEYQELKSKFIKSINSN